MQSNVVIHLNDDDIPMCPVHGIRLPTDFFEAGNGEPEHEVGVCKLCRRSYFFITREDKYL